MWIFFFSELKKNEILSLDLIKRDMFSLPCSIMYVVVNITTLPKLITNHIKFVNTVNQNILECTKYFASILDEWFP